MGIGNFFDNFMGGLAFGMLTNLSYGFGGWGGGCCYGSFPMMGGFGYQNNQFDYIFDESYKNSFPQIDYSSACQSIWDMAKKSTEDYYSRMQASSGNSSIPLSVCNQSMPQYSMPFSGYYFSTFQSPYFSGYYPSFGSQVISKNEVKSKEDVKSKEEVKPKEEVKIQEKVEELEPKKTDAEEKKNNKTEYATSREFASIYQDLGITDKRFIKIFEESILKSEGREYIFDVHAMAKSGVQQGTYNDYRKKKNLPVRDVKNMTNKEMCEIYYGIYTECGANNIKNDKMALYVFDVAVNSGSSKAKEFYSKSGGNTKTFEQLRIDYYKYLARSNPSKYGEYLDGWLKRVEKVHRYADSNFSTVA